MKRNSERPRLLVLGCCENTIKGLKAHQYGESEYLSDRFKSWELNIPCQESDMLILNGIAPPGYYFGQHPNDMDRLGFWPMDEDL
jgi:hypothetical protein